ncbi:heavy-metal-associated domain-containing protein [Paenibacillus naphthalenovorans]|uniref:heavy-metal-associated domain-containing protein n=1 Tax=Paenibacillus naphthalenovorans TaxID=162209 RepID=UPI003D2C08A8
MITKTVVVQGMDDQEDVNKVRRALHEVWGVDSVEVSLSKKKATFTYDETAASFRDFEQAVHELGYEIKTEDGVAE